MFLPIKHATMSRKKPNMAVLGPSKHTKIERVTRMYVVSLGLNHRLHAKDVPGCPDLLIGRLAVFCDGRFWHCDRSSKALEMNEFWVNKVLTNARRDRRNRRKLRALGYSTVTVWDDDSREAMRSKISRALMRSSGS